MEPRILLLQLLGLHGYLTCSLTLASCDPRPSAFWPPFMLIDQQQLEQVIVGLRHITLSPRREVRPVPRHWPLAPSISTAPAPHWLPARRASLRPTPAPVLRPSRGDLGKGRVGRRAGSGRKCRSLAGARDRAGCDWPAVRTRGASNRDLRGRGISCPRLLPTPGRPRPVP